MGSHSDFILNNQKVETITYQGRQLWSFMIQKAFKAINMNNSLSYPESTMKSRKGFYIYTCFTFLFIRNVYNKQIVQSIEEK